LFRYQDGWAAFRAVDHVARLAPVQLGHANQLEAEILGGLEAGDRVVVHPGELKDGVRIVERQ
jgi:HlyD family secretion protein